MLHRRLAVAKRIEFYNQAKHKMCDIIQIWKEYAKPKGAIEQILKVRDTVLCTGKELKETVLLPQRY